MVTLEAKYLDDVLQSLDRTRTHMKTGNKDKTEIEGQQQAGATAAVLGSSQTFHVSTVGHHEALSGFGR